MSQTVRWDEITAIFGGTFDPPHLGHREAVLGLFENPGVRRVLVIPSAIPPFKAQATSSEDRFRMTELAFAGLSDVHVDRREIDRAARSSAPSYSIDTIFELKHEYPNLAFVAGTDQLAALHTWHRFPELLGSCHWIVLARKPEGDSLAQPVLQEWEASGMIRKKGDDWETSGATRIRVVETRAPALSSTEIRSEIARSTEPQALDPWLKSRLPSTVLTYLMEHRIYGMNPVPEKNYEHER